MAIIGAAVFMRLRQVIAGDATVKLITIAVTLGGVLLLMASGLSSTEGFSAVTAIFGLGLGYVFGRNPPGDSTDSVGG